MTKLDDFVSHSWRTSRFKKHGALLLHFNALASIMAVWMSFCAVTALEYYNVIPTLIEVKMTLPDMGGFADISEPWVMSGMPQVKPPLKRCRAWRPT